MVYKDSNDTQLCTVLLWCWNSPQWWS